MVRKTIFRNESTEVIPPYAVIRITGSDELTDGTFIWTAEKPDDENTIIRVNGPFEIETFEYGECSPFQGPVWCLFDDEEEPEFAEEWGPVDDSWKLTKSGTSVTISGTPSGEIVKVNMEGSGGGCDPQNEIQTLHLIGFPTSGSFTLTVNSETTESIEYDASNEDIKDAIEALEIFNPDDIEVTGGLPSSALIEFTGGFENTQIDIIIPNADALEGLGIGIFIIANQRGRQGG